MPQNNGIPVQVGLIKIGKQATVSKSDRTKTLFLASSCIWWQSWWLVIFILGESLNQGEEEDVTMQKLKYDETHGNNVAPGNSKFVQFT